MGSKDKSYADLKFSVNLIDASRRQLYFLKEVNKYPDLYQGPLVREAIRRYKAALADLVIYLGSILHSLSLTKQYHPCV